MRIARVLLIAGFVIILTPGASRSQTTARGGGHTDTLALALAAAQWASPHLQAGRRIALAYGTQRGAAISGLVRNAAEGATIASAFHGVAVLGDSVRGCGNTCVPGEFDVVVQIGGRFVDDTTALADVVVRDYPASGRGGLRGWEARFRYSGGRWVFDSVLVEAAS